MALRDALDEKDIKHAHLGKLVGVSQQSVSRWVSGEVVPQRKNVIAIAQALGDDRDRWLDLWVRSEPRAKNADPGLAGHSGSDGWPAWLEEWLRTEIGAVREEMEAISRRVEELAAERQQPPA